MSARPQPHASTAPRAIIYVRQSTYREESISLELQEETARAYAERQGYRVVGVEADPGITGRTWKRPAVQRVMARLERGEADRIILWKWSRLSRDDYDWAVARKIAATAGGRIESATEPNPEDSPEGKLMLSQMISFAVYESDRIGAVWKDVHQHRRRAGLPAQGGDRYGYQRDGDTYTPHPVQGPILAAAYRRYLDGEGFTRIVRWLNESGIPNRHGNVWSRTTLSDMLDSGFGAGLIVHGKGQQATWHEGAHQAVISAYEWQQYRERRAEAPAPPRTVEPSYFLSGIIRCGDCGASMHATNMNRQPGAGYVCSRWSATKAVRCVTASRARAEAATLEWVRELAHDVERQTEIELRQSRQQVIAVDDAAAIERRITAIDVKLATLTTRYLDGKVPEAAYAATSARLQAEHDSHKERLTRATRRAQSGSYDFTRMRATLDLWSRMTVLEQREFVASLVREVRAIPPAEVRRGGGARVRFEIVPHFDE